MLAIFNRKSDWQQPFSHIIFIVHSGSTTVKLEANCLSGNTFQYIVLRAIEQKKNIYIREFVVLSSGRKNPSHIFMFSFVMNQMAVREYWRIYSTEHEAAHEFPKGSFALMLVGAR